MKIIIGLGNPMPKYKGTRHNVGQIIVSYFQEINNFPGFKLKKKLEGLISEGKIGEKKIALVLPQTFMNESGRAVKKLITNYQLPITNLIVIHDDIDLPLGTIRIKKGGSSGGHNGVQSIIDHLKIQDFVRIKIGVANEKRGLVPAEKFVLEKFSKEETMKLSKIKDLAIKTLENILNEGEIKKQTFSA